MPADPGHDTGRSSAWIAPEHSKTAFPLHQRRQIGFAVDLSEGNEIAFPVTELSALSDCGWTLGNAVGQRKPQPAIFTSEETTATAGTVPAVCLRGRRRNGRSSRGSLGRRDGRPSAVGRRSARVTSSSAADQSRSSPVPDSARASSRERGGREPACALRLGSTRENRHPHQRSSSAAARDKSSKDAAELGGYLPD